MKTLTPRPDPHSRDEEGAHGRGAVLHPPLYSPGSPLRGLQMSGQLAGLHHGGHWVSSWGQNGGGSWAKGVLERALGDILDPVASRDPALSRDHSIPGSTAVCGHCIGRRTFPSRTPELFRLVVRTVATGYRQSLIWRHLPSLAHKPPTPGVLRFRGEARSGVPCPLPLDGQAGGFSCSVQAHRSSASSRW